MRLRTITMAAFVVAAIHTAVPVAAEQAIPTVRIPFDSDPNGYGAALSWHYLGSTLDMWRRQSGSPSFAAAVIDLDVDGQPEYAVRVNHPVVCDEYGCMILVFRHDGIDWKPVLQAKSRDLDLGPLDPTTGKAVLVTDGGTLWLWDGSRYDIQDER